MDNFLFIPVNDKYSKVHWDSFTLVQTTLTDVYLFKIGNKDYMRITLTYTDSGKGTLESGIREFL